MPSNLRIQTQFEPVSAETTRARIPSQLHAQKKQKMSLSQTYFIAASARSKLGKEASRADHDLRLLVGHANLLDSLMLDLQDAERDQEAWFHETVHKAQKADKPRHVTWVDSIPEDAYEEEEDDAASDSSDSDEEDIFEEEIVVAPVQRLPSPPAPRVSTQEIEDEDEDDFYEDLEDDEEHALTRVSSSAQPPELIHEDSDSDDDSMPPSPPQPTMEYTENARQSIKSANYYNRHPALSESEQNTFVQEGFFIPERSAPLITSY
ncbi:hypothetical protein BDY21DRAFT_414820 [Lineolata rhizophorae]|uniref:Uncharacterized protein n=1 Tax=Lineolata rhizophorae TaxID=578093 RepID=A0A6A6P1E5_9PEZI|nr:hypothetical protein BDY21DRAFT_414820 [Lineolata rhizophorae]